MGRPLLEALVVGNVLDEGHVAQLAVVFLDADEVCLTAPGAWLADYYLQKRGGELRRLDPHKTYTLRRVIGPQLRRWAARETVRVGEHIGPVLRRALAPWTAATAQRWSSGCSTRPTDLANKAPPA